MLAGCSIHPLPDDVLHVSTFEIIQQVRCEAREAVISQLIEELRRRLPDGTLNPAEIAIADALESDDPNVRLDIRTFRERYSAGVYPFDETTKKRIDYFRLTAIGFAFKFDITETNKSDSGFGLRDPFGWGVFDIGVSASERRDRRNERKITISNTFDQLLADDALATKCNSYAVHDENWIYPVRGRIGLDEVIDTFLEVATEVGVTEKTAVGREAKGLVGNMVDTLTFTTHLTTAVGGGTQPILTLTPSSKQLHVDAVGANVSAERKDIHEVLVTVVPPGTFEEVLAKRLRNLAEAALFAAEAEADDDLDDIRDAQRELQQLLGQ